MKLTSSEFYVYSLDITLINPKMHDTYMGKKKKNEQE